MNNCKNEKCSKCGECCTPFLPMTKNEVKMVRDYLKNHSKIKEKALENPIFKDGKIIIRCCFYDANKKECMIYPVRPLICQMYKCNQSKLKIEKNKDFVIAHSFYNTDINTIDDFRSLLFGDYRMLVLAVGEHLKKKPEELVEFFKEIGRDDVAIELQRQIELAKREE